MQGKKAAGRTKRLTQITGQTNNESLEKEEFTSGRVAKQKGRRGQEGRKKDDIPPFRSKKRDNSVFCLDFKKLLRLYKKREWNPERKSLENSETRGRWRRVCGEE